MGHWQSAALKDNFCSYSLTGTVRIDDFFWLASLTIAYFTVVSAGGDGQSRLRVLLWMSVYQNDGAVAAVYCKEGKIIWFVASECGPYAG